MNPPHLSDARAYNMNLDRVFDAVCIVGHRDLLLISLSLFLALFAPSLLAEKVGSPSARANESEALRRVPPDEVLGILPDCRDGILLPASAERWSSRRDLITHSILPLSAPGPSLSAADDDRADAADPPVAQEAGTGDRLRQ
jgi:hypothetical protein